MSGKLKCHCANITQTVAKLPCDKWQIQMCDNIMATDKEAVADDDVSKTRTINRGPVSTKYGNLSSSRKREKIDRRRFLAQHRPGQAVLLTAANNRQTTHTHIHKKSNMCKKSLLIFPLTNKKKRFEKCKHLSSQRKHSKIKDEVDLRPAEIRGTVLEQDIFLFPACRL